MPHRPQAFILTDPRVLKAVGDRLRRRVLLEFCGDPITTKQLATRLGIKSNKLYHHVNVLSAVGLIELVGTKAKRGTTEKYFQAIARSFVLDPVVLQEQRTPTPIEPKTTPTNDELEALGSNGSPVIVRSKFAIPPSKIAEFQDRMEQIAAELCHGNEAAVECSLIAVAYRAAS